MLTVALVAMIIFALPAAADIEKDGKVVITIDAGHGGIDGGSDKGTVPEKYYNMKLAQYLRDALEADGRFTVVMTRNEDVYLQYCPRAEIAKNSYSDLIISMHCNTIEYSYVDGNSAYISLIEDYSAEELANNLLDAISAASPIRRGEVYTRQDTGDSYGVYYWDYEKQWDMPGAWWLGKVSDYYSINTWASKFGIPSIIIEHGYLTNAHDLSVLDNDSYLRAIAQAEANAIIEYYTNHQHEFGDYTVDHPSNCTFTGTESKRCIICGARSGVRDLPAAPDNHFWRQTASAEMTCESDGYISYVCQFSFNANDKGHPCEVHEKTDTTPASGHDYTVIEDTQSTHDGDGKLHMICNTCQHEVLEIRAGEGHNWAVTSETLPTCLNDGERHYSCEVCNETMDEILPAIGHAYEVVEDREATHTEDGIFKQVCSLCGDEIVENREAEGHSFEFESKQLPTCILPGKRISKCTVCGEITEQELLALGHTEVTSDDGKTVTCSVCGTIVSQKPKSASPLLFICAAAAICLIAGAGIFVIINNTKKAKAALGIDADNIEQAGIAPELTEVKAEYDDEINAELNSYMNGEK